MNNGTIVLGKLELESIVILPILYYIQFLIAVKFFMSKIYQFMKADEIFWQVQITKSLLEWRQITKSLLECPLFLLQFNCSGPRFLTNCWSIKLKLFFIWNVKCHWGYKIFCEQSLLWKIYLNVIEIETWATR